MRTENVYCDYCHKKTTVEGQVKEKLNGFCLELGYSEGGWGTRRDFIPKHSVEICDECFAVIKFKANDLDKIIKSLKKGRTSLIIK